MGWQKGRRQIRWWQLIGIVLLVIITAIFATSPNQFIDPNLTSPLVPITNMGLLDAVVHLPKAKHTASVIFLHGLGDSGHGWSQITGSFAQAMPYVKWIFPHAPTGPVTLQMGYSLPRWYDVYTLDDLDDKVDQDGLMASAAKVNELIENEIKSNSIPSNRIAVAGFSQGGAMSLLTVVNSPHKLAAVAVLSGYFPLSKQFDTVHNSTNQNTPIWMGHGTSDQVVKFTMGTKSKDFLEKKGYTITFNNYHGMGHSANDEELQSLKLFFREHLAE